MDAVIPCRIISLESLLHRQLATLCSYISSYIIILSTIEAFIGA